MNSRIEPRFLVDTDILSLSIRGHRGLNSRLLQYAESWAISSITAVELGRYARLAKSTNVRQLTSALLLDCWIVDFDTRAAAAAAEVLHATQLSGASIGFADAQIAGHAQSLGLPVVTNNIKHFGRVSGLRVLNWLE